MSFKKGEDRYQVRLLPPAIEDYVPQDDEVRVTDAFVDKLTTIIQILKDEGINPTIQKTC